MSSYVAPVNDVKFILDHVVDLPSLANRIDRFAGATPEIVDAVLDSAARFAGEILAPLNRRGDEQGCSWQSGGIVHTPDGFREAYRAFASHGWTTLCAPEAFGGQNLPKILETALTDFAGGANLAFVTYPALTHGAVQAILANGSETQKSRYLPKMVSGEWTGTMNLTEPQCGTDLGLIRTKAARRPDGTFGISGTKIFITSGEHDLAENIIHLVLAKSEGGPDNVRGLSLFIVPKLLLDDAGSPAVRNAVTCGSIEHKMGLSGSATCVMHYEDATGFLLGEEHQGLAAMFVMMNLARLGTGMQNVSLAEGAYQMATRYAHERRQGRAAGGAADPEAKADPIIVHADVRRMLLETKTFVEGGRALGLWLSAQYDLADHAPTHEERMAARDMLALLTPVFKAFGSDGGYRAVTLCQQIFGGMGYIRETGIEQFVRDARIAMIWEGANGIQALDLVHRKIQQNGGQSMKALLTLLATEIAATPSRNQDLGEHLHQAIGVMRMALEDVEKTRTIHPDASGSCAYAVLELVGYVSFGFMWLKMANAAAKLIDGEHDDRLFLESKIAAGRFYMEQVLPQIFAILRKITNGSASLISFPGAAYQ